MSTPTAGLITRGLAALALLLALIVGLPLALLHVAGSPVPAGIPDLDQVWTVLTSRDDGTMLLGLLKYVAWAGWALFAASVAADLLARARGLRAPHLGPQQRMATQLVGAVLALAVTIPGTATASPGVSGPAPVSVTVATPLTPHITEPRQGVDWRASIAQASSTRQTATAQHESERSSAFTRYTVRRGDCLWDIAWNELGDPERWPELYEASRHIRQPDGQRITDPDHIEPGWTVLIPKHVASLRSSASGQSEDRSAATLRPTPRVVTPLHLPASARSTELRTPLTVGSSVGSNASVDQAGSLDTWETGVLRHDQGAGARHGWRARIGEV